MVQIIKLIYPLEEKKDSKVYKENRVLEVRLVRLDLKVFKGLKVRRVRKVTLEKRVRLDHKVNWVPHLLMKILLKLNLKD